MKKFVFETSIKCGNCLRSVSPILNSMVEIDTWSVDLEHQNHLLTIEGEVDANEIVDKLANIGFSAKVCDAR